MKIIVIEKKGAVKEQINEIKPQLRDIIVNLQKSDTLKSKLTKASIFNSSKDVDELFESLLSRYQISLETCMRRSDFIFDSVQFLYYKCPNKHFKRDG